MLCLVQTCGPDILIHRKADDGQTFHKNWGQFKNGFGHESNGDKYWIGNDRLHSLTVSEGYTRLRVEMRRQSGDPV